MGTAVFYHLTRSSPEATLATILPKALNAGWRVMVRGTDPQMLEALDRQLWTEPEDVFLPHAVEGGPFDSQQPILLGRGAALNAAQSVALVGGAEPLAGEERMERIWVLFEGGDEAAVKAARGLWTRLTAAGMAAQYWSEETGRWVMKAEKK
jgi:DNA polymerase-3 subunit chi